MGKADNLAGNKQKEERLTLSTERARAPYWGDEQPLIMVAGNLQITYFEKNGALQIGFLKFDEFGNKRITRRISLRRDIISKTPRALYFLRDVFENWSDGIVINSNCSKHGKQEQSR